jgi:peroxiredoxin
MKHYLIFTALVLAVTFGIQSFTPLHIGPSTQYKVGDVARDFSLKNVDGKMISLAGYKDAKGFIVVFTCNHCPVAKLYESRIMALDQQFAAKGYPVIAINPTDPSIYPDDTYQKMVSYAKERNYSFPYLDDATQEITRTYGATNTPHVFVLNRENGKLIVRYVGAIDDNAEDASQAKTHYVADAVNALLAGKPVAVTKTKAIGCGIKMKQS